MAVEDRPAPPTGRVLCVPASDEADEVTATMLALLLEQSGCVVLPFTRDPGLPQLALVQPSAGDIFCISALPPFAFAHARTLSSQLRARFPGIRIVVGVWGFSGATEQAMERFQTPRPEKLVTSMAAAIQAVMMPADTLTEGSCTRQRVGTGPAPIEGAFAYAVNPIPQE